MEGESGEQVGGELESVTSSAGCFVQGWRKKVSISTKIAQHPYQTFTHNSNNDRQKSSTAGLFWRIFSVIW